MNNEAIIKSLFSLPSSSSTLPVLKEQLKTLDRKDGALLLFDWVTNAIDLIDNKKLETKGKRFLDLFKVMKFIEKQYPEVLELEDPVHREGQEIQKLLVRFLTMRENHLSCNFKEITKTESLIRAFGEWDFKKILEEWAKKDIFLESHEKQVLLKAAFSVDTQANLKCIEKWWNPQEEINNDLYFTAIHAVNSKHVKRFADLLNASQSSPYVADDFYEKAYINCFFNFVKTSMDYEQSSLAYILQNARPNLSAMPNATQSKFGATLYVLANNLEAWTLIKSEDIKKITRDILWGTARIDYQEGQNAIEEVFYIVRNSKNNQLDLLPYVLEREESSQKTDFMFYLELNEYMDQNDLAEIGSQKIIEYIEKIKHKSPSLFYFISVACDQINMEKIQALKKVLNASPEHSKDWKEKLGIDLNAEQLQEWSRRIVELLDTNYLDEERVSLIFEELDGLNKHNNPLCSWMNAVFEQEEDLMELSEKVADEPLELKDQQGIINALNTIGRADLSQAFESLILNHELKTKVKKAKPKSSNPLSANRF